MEISEAHILELITSACPSFLSNARFLQWKTDWKDDASPPYYLLSSALVRHLIQLHLMKQYDEFDAVFVLVEELHVRGDEYVAEWATIGILEDLQNGNLHPAGSQPAVFEEFLGPVSKWWWDELNLFWSGKISCVGTSGRPRP